MIQIKNITKTFQSNFWEKKYLTLKDVSFTIKRGKTTGFLGSNGAGKTTLMKIIMQFIRADSGRIDFCPTLGSKRVEIFSKMAYLPERPYFYPHLTGRDFLIFMSKLNNMTQDRIDRKMISWTKRLKIFFALDKKVGEYSKGMLQRLGLVSVLLHDPELIILDEPLSGLDPIGRKEFKDIFIDLRDQGKTLFFSSHIVPDIEEICDRLVVLDTGKIIYDIEMSELLVKDASDRVEIIYKELNGDTKIKYIQKSKQKSTLTHLLSEDKEIVSLRFKTPSLEEIIYYKDMKF